MGLGPHLRGLGRSPIETGATRSLQQGYLRRQVCQPCHLQRLAQLKAICRNRLTSPANFRVAPN
jgi:hypothetical protein